jgi:hypothetical protein
MPTRMHYGKGSVGEERRACGKVTVWRNALGSSLEVGKSVLMASVVFYMRNDYGLDHSVMVVM